MFIEHIVKYWYILVNFSFLNLLVAGLICWFLIFLYNAYKHADHFPMVAGIPFVQNAIDLGNLKFALPKLVEYTISTGKVVRIMIGPCKPSLLVADRKLIELTAVTANKHVTKAKYYRFLHKWLGTGLITSDGGKWKSRRRAMTASFSQSSILQNFIDVFERQGNLLLNVLENEIGKEYVDLHPIIKRFTIDVICECALGVAIHTQKNKNSEYADSVEVVQEVAILRHVSLYKRFDFLFQFTDDFRREKFALKVLDDFFDNILERKKKNGIRGSTSQLLNADTGRNKENGEVNKCNGLSENAHLSVNGKRDIEDVPLQKTNNEKPQALLDLLLNLEIDGKSMSRDDLREEINTIVFAGYDTTATAICYTLYAVANHPEVQKKILEEQKKIFGENMQECKTTYDSIGKMDYLDLVIKESLRMYPPVPLIGKRAAKELFYDDNIKVPEGMNMATFIYGTHRHPDYFHDPNDFIPERFKDDTLVPYTYLPFSLGPRQCIGKRFALLEIKSTLSKIFRNYRVIPVPGHQLHLVASVTLISTTGMCVSLEKI